MTPLSSLSFGVVAALLSSTAIAQPVAMPSAKALSATGLDSQIVQSVLRVKDPGVMLQLTNEGKLLQVAARTEFARKSLERKIADRTFLYHLATGTVSAEALQGANLTRDELLRAARASDPYSPALVKARASFDTNRTFAIGYSLMGRPSVQQVDPDTPAPLESTPTAPTGAARYDPSLNRFDRPVYRQGFTEVVAIGQRAAGNSVGTIHCSGTMLKSAWLVTAAHCMFDKAGARIPDEKLVVYMPFQGGSEQAMAVQGLNRNLRSFALIPGSISLLDSNFKPSTLYEFDSAKDLAVMRVAVSSNAATWRAVALRTADKAEPFTMAGYGLTNAADPGKDGSTLEIARRTADARVFPKYILYESVDTKGMGRVCSGDSGGPVFAGELNGGPKPSEHELVGVVSGSTAAGQSVAFCRAGNQFIVRVNTVEVAKWMCTSTKNSVCY